VPAVWKEETLVFVCDRVRVERIALGIVGGQNEVVEAVQDEASPTPLLFLLPPWRGDLCLSSARAQILLAYNGVHQRELCPKDVRSVIGPR
jgi:hypothetical protein